MTTGSKAKYAVAVEEAIQALFNVSAKNNNPVSTEPLTVNELIFQTKQAYNGLSTVHCQLVTVLVEVAFNDQV